MSKTAPKRYAEDGVNVADEATFSSYAGSVCKASYKNSPFVTVHDLSEGSFRGPRPISFTNLPAGFFVELSSDGIGTKGILVDAADSFETAAFDLMAMVASDITRYGGVPLVITNTMDIAEVGAENSPENAKYKRLLTGLDAAAKASNAVILKGETAQMAACVSSEISDSKTRFNWGATMLGVYHKEKMVTGDSLAPGQKVIALKEDGFRCNGISSLRKALVMQYGKEWWNNPDATEDIKAAAAPSVLYDQFVNSLHGWYAEDWQAEVTLHAIVHLSGGGIKEKFANDLVLQRGFSATLDDLFEPPEIMKKCADWRGIEDEEFY
ncbi:AIR synthase related protein, partial [Candidatus Pacebacteria bacterium]|nr:AIR synthase related protein [Candidatus Paceibacterota bacterium]